MPYYCTVPRCTSMAGKAKNVSFHQFPRDEELAQLWNEILKRGKPYTKYSKVCSLHFKPEDYTVTSVGKNKGQWRTLRKDAIPSRNLPTDTPTGLQRTRSTNSWTSGSLPPNLLEPQIHQQVAQAIYMQTMLAMQAAGDGLSSLPSPQNSDNSVLNSAAPEQTSERTLSEYEKFLVSRQIMGSPSSPESDRSLDGSENNTAQIETKVSERFNINSDTDCKGLIGDRLSNGIVKSFKCDECSKCFKDPDVFVLHKRTHRRLGNHELQNVRNSENGINEKENLNNNSSDIQNEIRQDTLKANPILANLLKSGVQHRNGNEAIQFDPNVIWNLENQIMAAMAANMEAYIRNLASAMTNSNFTNEENTESKQNNHDSETEDSLENTEIMADVPQSEITKSTVKINDDTLEISNENVKDDIKSDVLVIETKLVQGKILDNDMNRIKIEESTKEDNLVQNSTKDTEDLIEIIKTERVQQVLEPNCDNKDLVE